MRDSVAITVEYRRSRDPPRSRAARLPSFAAGPVADDGRMATTRRADMFTADGRPSDADPREHGPTLNDERTTLVEALRCQRLTREVKCAADRRAPRPVTERCVG